MQIRFAKLAQGGIALHIQDFHREALTLRHNLAMKRCPRRTLQSAYLKAASCHREELLRKKERTDSGRVITLCFTYNHINVGLKEK